ncbi:MAG: carboxypeptidase-like regulatory domain-containing protein, partial [Gemmatimonadetes bacterium]|nr:carboxypeptidase-like regulatory domain-containing protein [Gemmatimonadota bacterium]
MLRKGKVRLGTAFVALIVVASVARAAPLQRQAALLNEWEVTSLKPRPAGVLSQPARLDVEGVSLASALERLQASANVPLAYSPSFLPSDDQPVTCVCGDRMVGEALDQLLGGTPLGYAVLAGTIVITRDRIPAADFAVALRPIETPSVVVELTRPKLPAPKIVLAPEERVGTLTGQVVAAGTLRPLVGAQVYVVGTSIGGLTNASGRYLFTNVPDGSATLRVELIGYAAAERQVTITPGSTLTQDFQLTEEALSLDEIVVTGTAGTARRREVGNTIAQINTATISEPITSVDGLLQARAPGVLVSAQSGGSGSGATIRLRGNVSVALSNQPLLYVDGVRVKSEPYPLGADGARAPASPLNDINPADVERIEIIKGAAATTLYGTEAAAGVIQIFTKKGTQGAPVWT